MIQTQEIKKQYSPAISTTVYPFAIRYFEEADIGVTIVNSDGITVELTLNAVSLGFTVVPVNGDPNNGATITTSEPYTDGESVTIYRAVPKTQLADFQRGGDLPPEVLNGALDRNVAISQEIDDTINRTMTGPITDAEGVDYELPSAEDRTGRLITFDSDGNIRMVDPTTEEVLLNYQYSTNTGDGVNNSFALDFIPDTTIPEAYRVAIDGITQNPDDAYTITVTNIVFTSVPPLNSEISVVTVSNEGAIDMSQGVVTPTGADTPRILADRLADVINIKDFGAVGDGLTDDTASIQAAVTASSGKIVKVPVGTYIITSTIAIPSGTSIKGEGAGDTIIIASSFGTSADVLSITTTTGEGLFTEISDLTIQVKNTHARYAIVTPQLSTTSYKPRYKFSGLLFKGSNIVSGGSSWEQDYGFTACIRLGDCMSADLRDIQIWGTYNLDAIESASPDQTGLLFDGAESLRNIVVDNYLTSDLKFAIDIGEKNSSLYISNVDCSRCWYGIRTVTTNNSGEFFATGCTFNAQRIGVELKNRSWLVLQGVFATRHSLSYDHSEDWNGFAFTGVNNAFISNCRALHPGTWVNVGDRIGFNLNDVLFSKFVNILCSSSATVLEYGFKIYNNSTNLMFSNIFFDDVKTWWDFGTGTADINITNHSHRGAVTSKYAGHGAVSVCNIMGYRVNYNNGLLEVDPSDNAVNIGSNTLRVDDGTVWFGSHTALGAETVTGFITINDASGTQRKIAIVS